jgi:NitT/TauT family transport system substrate-binding protein
MPTLRPLRMQLNTFLSGPQAWFFLAEARGYLAQEGLSLDFVEGDTAANVVPKMMGGGFDVGYGDLNALISQASLDLGLDAPWRRHLPLAVFASYNASPYTLAVAQSSGISSPLDLPGKSLVTHPNDAACRMFSVFCEATGLRRFDVAIDTSSAPHSELVPRLLAGEWDGMFGFVNTLVAAALDAGIEDPHSQLRFMEYHDHVPDLYGMALMVRRDLAATEPETVKGLLRALNRGLVDTVADPDAAIEATRAYCAARGRPFNVASNFQRLLGTLALEMGRAEGARLGIGDLDDARFQRGIDLLARTLSTPVRTVAADLFDRSFLPPLGSRVTSLFQGPSEGPR